MKKPGWGMHMDVTKKDESRDGQKIDKAPKFQ